MALVNTHQVLKHIESRLFAAEFRRLEAEKDRIVQRNKELNRDHPHDGMTYKGEFFAPSNLIQGGGARKTRSLHQQLVSEMEAFLADRAQVTEDQRFIRQILGVILKPCNSDQDIRDALPNCLTDTMDSLKGLRRTRDEAYTLEGNERLQRQYQQILPRIEFYATARLLY